MAPRVQLRDESTGEAFMLEVGSDDQLTLHTADGASQLGVLAGVEEIVEADFTAGQNLNQTAGTLTTTTPLSFTGTPARVEITLNIHGMISNTAAVARPAPVMELYRGATLLLSIATGYIRDSNDHEESSYNAHFIDTSPGTDPVYTIQTRRDSTISGAVTCQAPSTAQLIAKGLT